MKDDKIITDTILVALFTLFGYAAAFSFTKGYLSFFSIPAQFIELSLTTILISISSLFFVLYIFVTFIDVLVSMGLFKNETAVQRQRAIFIVLVTLSALFFIFVSPTITSAIFLGIMILFLIILEVVLPLVNGRGKEGWEAKLQAHERIEEELLAKGLVSRMMQSLKDKIGLTTYRLFFISLLIVFSSYLFGYGYASGQKTYVVSVSDPENALVQVNSQEIIFAKFNQESKELTGEFSVLSKSDIATSSSYIKKHVGPLRGYNQKIIFFGHVFQ